MAEKFFAWLGTAQVGVMASVLGGMVWLTEIHLTTQVSAESLKKIELDVQEMKIKAQSDKSEVQQLIYEKLTEIDQRLSRIEGRLQK